MPRPTKARILTRTRHEWLECYLAVREMPFPHTDTLLLRIVQALLFRLMDKDPIGAKDLEILIHDMAAREHHFENFPTSSAYDEPDAWSKTMRSMDEMVTMLAVGRTSTRDSHYQAILRRQKDVLCWQLDSLPPFPFRCNQRSLRSQWLRKHQDEILKLVTVFPCQCTYSKALARNIKEEDIQDCRTPGRLTSLILAGIHKAAPQHILNLLKPSRTPH